MIAAASQGAAPQGCALPFAALSSSPQSSSPRSPPPAARPRIASARWVTRTQHRSHVGATRCASRHSGTDRRRAPVSARVRHSTVTHSNTRCPPPAARSALQARRAQQTRCWQPVPAVLCSVLWERSAPPCPLLPGPSHPQAVSPLGAAGRPRTSPSLAPFRSHLFMNSISLSFLKTTEL